MLRIKWGIGKPRNTNLVEYFCPNIWNLDYVCTKESLIMSTLEFLIAVPGRLINFKTFPGQEGPY